MLANLLHLAASHTLCLVRVCAWVDISYFRTQGVNGTARAWQGPRSSASVASLRSRSLQRRELLCELRAGVARRGYAGDGGAARVTSAQLLSPTAPRYVRT